MGSFGSRLSQLRNKRGISQEDLSKILKIAKSTLGMYETDKREPSHDTITRIADYFGVSLDWLLTGKSNTNMSAIAEEDEKLIEDFSKLTEKDQEYILELIDRLKRK